MLSDGADPSLAELVGAAQHVQSIEVNGGERNVGITKFEVRPRVNRAGEYEILVNVANFSRQPESFELALSLNRKTLQRTRYTFEAGERQSLIFPYTGTANGVAEAVLESSRIVWDRVGGELRARDGARRLAVTSGGTIPDRGLFGVFLPDGTRVGELDEEMVYESRPGETFLLGASTWRIEDISFERVVVSPAPGQPVKSFAKCHQFAQYGRTGSWSSAAHPAR